jgi:hypothetical protein
MTGPHRTGTGNGTELDAQQKRWVQLAFAKRARRHLLATNVLVFGCAAIILVLRFLTETAWQVAMGLGALALMGGWIIHTVRIWRCPACDGQLAWNTRPRHCGNCGYGLPGRGTRWINLLLGIRRCPACGNKVRARVRLRYCWTCGVELKGPNR